MSFSDDNAPFKAEEIGQQAWEKLQQARKVEREQLNLLKTSTGIEDEAWARWEYSPDEWELFDRVDWGLRGLFFRVLLICDIVFLLGAIPPWFFLSSDPSLCGVAFGADMVLLVGFFLFLIFYSYSYVGVSKRHKARQHLPRTVTFSKKGVWESGTFFPLNEKYNVDLEKVTLTSQPPVLRFYLKKWSWDSEGSGSSLPTTLRVLVPREHEGEAGLLLERFQTEVIAQRKAEEERARQEKERRKNPPEPR